MMPAPDIAKCLALAAGLALAGCASAPAPQPAPPPAPLSDEARAAATSAWANDLMRAIRNQWTPPPQEKLRKACRIAIVLREDGKVVDARVLESCGGNAIDRSVVTAIYKASPMPLPLEPAVFDPNVTVQFTP